MRNDDALATLEFVPLDIFAGYFREFKATAFRLELLPLYTVSTERTEYQRYLSGKPGPSPDFNSEWREILQESRNAGKTFSRIRVIDGKLTDYQRFEILWGYIPHRKLGENIRFIIRQEPSAFPEAVPILKDFWLFDNKDCFLMEYDYVGSFLGLRQLGIEHLSPYLRLVDHLLTQAISFEEGCRKLDVSVTP